MAPTAVCQAHVDDPVLREQIAAHATQPVCSYCDAGGTAEAPIAADLVRFMDVFMVGVDLFYQPNQGSASTGITSGDVAQRILQLAGITHRGLGADIGSALGATTTWRPQDAEHGSPVEHLTYSWDAFKHLVKHEMRFFFGNRPTGQGDDGDITARQLLEAVSDIGENTPEVWPALCPSPIYRARMARSKDEAAQWLNAADMGPPPPDLAAANRMSPAGISIFYGATDRVTAIAEAGSHTAFRYVVTGEFTPTRDARLIDLANLPSPPSIFDTANHKRYFVLRFLRKFIDDLTLPVELDGREHIDYVPTQVFTEYFRYAFPSNVDGLMFPSTQGPGNNVVLFYGPSVCANKATQTENVRLTLDTSTLEISRVMTVAR